MAEIEFLPSDDIVRTDEPAPAERSRRPRWVQRAGLGVLVAVGATLVVLGTGKGHPAQQQAKLPPIKPVHISKYTPWHERLITGGGGAYIF
jgi:hypothetical protein